MGDLQVQAVARVPWEAQWWKLGTATGNFQGSFLADKLSFNLGIQDGFFTSWAESFANGADKAFGIQGNVLLLDSTSEAYIGSGAQVAVGGDASIVAFNENDTLNIAGNFLAVFADADVTAEEAIGGAVLVVNYTNNVTAKIHSGAVVDSIDANKFKLIPADPENSAPNNELLHFVFESSDLTIDLTSGTTSTGHFFVPRPGRIEKENPLLVFDSNDDGKVNRDDERIVGLSGSTYLTDQSLLVLADDNSRLYSGTGGIAVGKNVGVGISVSVDNIHRATNAIIGRLDIDMLLEGQSSVGVGVDSNDEVYLGYNHGFSDGDRVTYSSGGDTMIDGLVDTETYYVNVIGDSDNSGDPTIRLARTLTEATSNPTFAPSSVSSTAGADVIDLGYAHGFQLGDPIRYDAGGSEVVGGLVDGNTYYVIPVDSNRIILAETEGNALQGHDFVFEPADTVDGNKLVFSYDHELTEGQSVLYTAGGGTPMGTMTDGDTYFVHVVNSTSIELRDSSNATITLTNDSSLGRRHTLLSGFAYSAAGNDGTPAIVDSLHKTIDLGYYHGLADGEPLLYTPGGSTAITGLTSGNVYHAIVDGENSVALATSQANAERGQWQYFDPTVDESNSVITLDGRKRFVAEDPAFCVAIFGTVMSSTDSCRASWGTHTR